MDEKERRTTQNNGIRMMAQKIQMMPCSKILLSGKRERLGVYATAWGSAVTSVFVVSITSLARSGQVFKALTCAHSKPVGSWIMHLDSEKYKTKSRRQSTWQTRRASQSPPHSPGATNRCQTRDATCILSTCTWASRC